MSWVKFGSVDERGRVTLMFVEGGLESRVSLQTAGEIEHKEVMTTGWVRMLCTNQGQDLLHHSSRFDSTKHEPLSTSILASIYVHIRSDT